MNAIQEPILMAEVRRHEEPCRSRWGWHVCSHDVYLKLKKIKKAYFEALRQSANFRRWYNKTVYRDPAKEPIVNPVFATNKPCYEKRCCGSNPKTGEGNIGLRWNPNPVDPGCYLDLFDKARKPNGNRVEPFDSLILGAIDEKYEKVIAQEAKSA